MANGDIAAAAGIATVPPTAKVKLGYDEINRALDTIVTEDNKVKARTVPVANGGTGATAAAAAAVNLNVVPWTAVAPKGTANAGGIARFSDAGRLQSVNPSATNDVATKGWVEQQGLGTSGTSLTLSGHLYVPAAIAAASGYVAAYINSDGRLSRGASSRRFKKYIRNLRRAAATLFGAPIREYQMRGADDGVYHVGLIAEELAERPELERYVIYDGEGQPEAIDHNGLLLAMVYELNARVLELEKRGS